MNSNRHAALLQLIDDTLNEYNVEVQGNVVTLTLPERNPKGEWTTTSSTDRTAWGATPYNDWAKAQREES